MYSILFSVIHVLLFFRLRVLPGKLLVDAHAAVAAADRSPAAAEILFQHLLLLLSSFFFLFFNPYP